MYRRILVPTDLTDRTMKALEVASNIAAPGDAQITLLHVIETIPGSDFEELASFYRKLEQHASDRLKEILARTTGKHVAVDTEIVYGKRAEEVLQFVRANDIDLSRPGVASRRSVPTLWRPRNDEL